MPVKSTGMRAGFVRESRLGSYCVSMTGSWLFRMPENGARPLPYRRCTTSEGEPVSLAVEIVMDSLSSKVSE